MYILLDCGHGTYGQILHLYGPEKTKEILRKLKFVFLSHGHADHHMVCVGKHFHILYVIELGIAFCNFQNLTC